MLWALPASTREGRTGFWDWKARKKKKSNSIVKNWSQVIWLGIFTELNYHFFHIEQWLSNKLIVMLLKFLADLYGLYSMANFKHIKGKNPTTGLILTLRLVLFYKLQFFCISVRNFYINLGATSENNFTAGCLANRQHHKPIYTAYFHT